MAGHCAKIRQSAPIPQAQERKVMSSNDNETMEVIVNGVKERRTIESYTRIDGGLMPGTLIANPVLRANEMATRTISGEVHILQA
jgi:hypothetical protein